jgi:hypothetical protein
MAKFIVLNLVSEERDDLNSPIIKPILINVNHIVSMGTSKRGTEYVNTIGTSSGHYSIIETPNDILNLIQLED